MFGMIKTATSHTCLSKGHNLEFLSLITRLNKNWHQPFKGCLTRLLPQARPTLRHASSLETYINKLDNLARCLELPKQQRIHYFIFGLKPKLKQALLIQQSQTYDNAVTFAKRKHHFADTDSETQLMDLLQEIRKELSLKHTGIKEEPYSVPIQDTHANHIHQKISQIKMDKQFFKKSMNTPHHQYAAPLHTNPVTFQQQLSKMKKDIKHLQQTKRPNVYPIPPGNHRSFRSADGLVICQWCNQVVHFARTCPANLPTPRTPTRYQNTDATIHPPPLPQPLYIFTVFPIDQATVDTIRWDIPTHKIPPVPIPHRDHYLHFPIEPTTSTKLKGPTFQVNNTLIVTW